MTSKEYLEYLDRLCCRKFTLDPPPGDVELYEELLFLKSCMWSLHYENPRLIKDFFVNEERNADRTFDPPLVEGRRLAKLARESSRCADPST
jgi:hypothetical protein